ncbi:MAG: sensor histidine kinase, partial [Cyclobacteriaceae bacterium]
MKRKLNRSHSLFWKISAIYLLMMTAVGIAYVFITQEEAEKHFMEKSQRLNAKIASSIISEVKPFLNGKETEAATDEIMHHMMAINPSIEVYLLDKEGQILNYVA